MSYRKDIIVLPQNFPFEIFHAQGMPDPDPTLHFHDCLEINFILGGNGTNRIGENEFDMEPGEIYVINNLEHHMAVDKGNLHMLVIIFSPAFIWHNQQFDYEYLHPFFNRNIHFSNRIKKESPFIPLISSIINEIEEEWTSCQEGYQLFVKALIMKLLAILYRHFKQSSEIGNEIKTFQKAYDRIKEAVEYIHCNFTTDVSLDELAAVASMNRTYFSSYFHKIMQMSISAYLQKLRINYACKLLQTTNESVMNICTNSGFNNPSHFNKVFKKIVGYSPNHFRYSKLKKTL